MATKSAKNHAVVRPSEAVEKPTVEGAGVPFDARGQFCFWEGDAPNRQTLYTRRSHETVCFTQNLTLGPGVHHVALGNFCASAKLKCGGQCCSKIAQGVANKRLSENLVDAILRHPMAASLGTTGLAIFVSKSTTVSDFLSFPKKRQVGLMEACSVKQHGMPRISILSDVLKDVLFTKLQHGLEWSVRCDDPAPEFTVENVPEGLKITVGKKGAFAVGVELGNTQNTLENCHRFSARSDRGGCSKRQKHGLLLHRVEGARFKAVAAVLVMGKQKPKINKKRKADAAGMTNNDDRTSEQLSQLQNALVEQAAKIAQMSERLAFLEKKNAQATQKAQVCGLEALYACAAPAVAESNSKALGDLESIIDVGNDDMHFLNTPAGSVSQQSSPDKFNRLMHSPRRGRFSHPHSGSASLQSSPYKIDGLMHSGSASLQSSPYKITGQYSLTQRALFGEDPL